jgi:hypothetical protein
MPGKTSFAIAIAIAVLVLNPLFACRTSGPAFTFGASEMRAAIEGTWVVEMPATGDRPAHDIMLSITHAGATPTRSSSIDLIRPAVACSHRTLVASAEACADETTMKLAVSHVALLAPIPITGTFRVAGLDFTIGTLELTLDDATLVADVNTRGEAHRVRVYHADRTSDATLTRVTRR